MTEQETIDIMCDLWDDISHHHTDCETLWSEEREEAFSMVMSALEEIQQYRAMEQRLKSVYGDCDGLLETVVAGLEKHEGTEIPEPITKARLLTDGMVDMWEEYKAIGTVEELKRMQKYSSLAKKHDTIGKVIEVCAEYAERCMDVIRNCDDCYCYKGCEDCASYGTEYCSGKDEVPDSR